MIGKIIIFIAGFIAGLLFGTAVGRWILEQIINLTELKGGII